MPRAGSADWLKEFTTPIVPRSLPEVLSGLRVPAGLALLPPPPLPGRGDFPARRRWARGGGALSAARLMAAAGAAPSGDAKRTEGDEWYDSGLGSLGEGQLAPLSHSPGPGPESPEEAPPEAPEPEAEVWLRHVLSFVSEDGDT